MKVHSDITRNAGVTVDLRSTTSDQPLPLPIQPSPDWLEPLPLPPDSPPAPQHHTELPITSSTARRFVQALILFLCLFLIVRTIAMEPFGVPTGSMAPKLIGNHREAPCPRCDFPIRVGEPGPQARSVRFELCRCPNCGASIDLSRAREVPGDRLMVDKTAFLSRKPNRWEVAVFHCPADSSKPYVKRIVGCPNELIQIFEGDIFANGELQRKTLLQVRETCNFVFDLNYEPKSLGWNSRWLVEPIAVKLPALNSGLQSKPVDNTILHDKALHLNAQNHPNGIGLTYRQWNLDTREDREEAITDWLAYNGGPEDRRGNFARNKNDASDLVHDFYVSFDLEIRAGAGTFACRLSDGSDHVRADLQLGSAESASPSILVVHDGGKAQKQGSGPRFQVGETIHVEFAFVDRRASLAINGKEVIKPLDLPTEPPGKPRRGGMSRPVQLGARGVSVVIQNFKLYRDIHYLPLGKSQAGWKLGPSEYFLLGDNTSNSHDSRLWTVQELSTPGVPEADFIGKPFLIHQPLRLGRVTINGRDRIIQTLDWSRLTWLR